MILISLSVLLLVLLTEMCVRLSVSVSVTVSFHVLLYYQYFLFDISGHTYFTMNERVRCAFNLLFDSVINFMFVL